MKRIIKFRGQQDINSLASRCGWFESKTGVNNGYGCTHTDQEEEDNGCGKCYAWSCPIAYQMDKQAWDKLGEDHSLFDEDWVCLHNEDGSDFKTPNQ